MELQDVVDHLNVQANAAMKVAQVAIELMMNLAASQGLAVDLNGAATALENADLTSVDPGTAQIERRARRVAGSILREMQIMGHKMKPDAVSPMSFNISTSNVIATFSCSLVLSSHLK